MDDNREESDQYFHRSVLLKVPNLPGPTNLVGFFNLSHSFLHCVRERNELKRDVMSNLPPKTHC